MSKSKKQIELTSLSTEIEDGDIHSALDTAVNAAFSALCTESDSVIEIGVLSQKYTKPIERGGNGIEVVDTTADAQVRDSSEIRKFLNLLELDTYPTMDFQQLMTQLGFDYDFRVKFNPNLHTPGGGIHSPQVLANILSHSVDIPHLLKQLPKPLDFVDAIKDNNKSSGSMPLNLSYSHSLCAIDGVWDTFGHFLLSGYNSYKGLPIDADWPSDVELEVYALTLPEDYFYQQLKEVNANSKIVF